MVHEGPRSSGGGVSFSRYRQPWKSMTRPVPGDAVVVAAFVLDQHGAEIDVRDARHRDADGYREPVVAHLKVLVIVIDDVQIAVTEVDHRQSDQPVPGLKIGPGHLAHTVERQRFGFQDVHMVGHGGSPGYSKTVVFGRGCRPSLPLTTSSASTTPSMMASGLAAQPGI